MQLTKILRSFSLGLLLIGGVLSPLTVTHAGMIGTESLISEAERTLNRDQLKSMLSREDVAEQLQSYGVNADDALMRVDRMTDEEVASLNDRLGDLPAGGDILGVAVVVFIVLVITDVIGATDIFPFIRPVKN